MKIKYFCQILTAFALLVASKSSALTGGNWFPAGGNGPGQITFVRYDITGALGELRVEIKDKASVLAPYVYAFDASNPSHLSRANAFYSAFLTAQASGMGILVYKMDVGGQINAIQVGN